MAKKKKYTPPAPRILRTGGKKLPKAFPKTASVLPGGATSGSGATNSISQSPLFYDYRYSTPDKFYFPKERAIANSVFRDMYRRDPTIAIGTDVYAELPWSNFEIDGIEDTTVRNLYEDMFTDLNLVPKFPTFTRDFLVTGEFIPHNIFNSNKGYWERVISHNPDYIEVQGLGLVADQPLLWMHPTPEILNLINSPDPRVQRFVRALPSSLVNAFRSGQKILLDNLNTGYFPRQSTSDKVRGESFYTRLFRSTMYEDFTVNASLAVSQRNAAPVRLIKLGDPSPNGWMPTDEDVDAFMEQLSMAEVDPLAAIVTHPFVSIDYIGVADKAMLISREWEFIERVKLLAMGMAKSFLVGETSFAAAVAGLQTLIDRLNSFREAWEYGWLIEKICKPIAEMHDFYERPQSQLEHRIRIDKPEERKLIVPKIRWAKNLESTQDTALLGVWRDLKERGILSDRTYAVGAGVDLETERRNKKEEEAYAEAQANPEPDFYTKTTSKKASKVNPYITQRKQAELQANVESVLKTSKRPSKKDNFLLSA